MAKMFRIGGIAVALVVITVVCLPFLIDANQFRPTIESRLSKALGREVTIGKLNLALLKGGVEASDVSIAEDPAFARTPFLQAKSLKIGVAIKPLIFERALNITSLEIVQPNVVLIENPAGKWNYSSLGADRVAESPGTPRSAKLNLSVKLIEVKDGRITLRTIDNPKPRVLNQLNADVRDFSAGAAFPFSLSTTIEGGGKVVVKGRAGPIDASDTAQTPLEFEAGINHLDLASSGLLDPATPVAGLVAIKIDGKFKGQHLNATGRIEAQNLKLVKGGSAAQIPVAFDFAIAHDVVKRTGSLSRGDIHLGKTTANLLGTYALRSTSALLNMKLSGNAMAVEELEAMLPVLAVILPAGSALRNGVAYANLTLQGPADQLVIDGPVGLKDTKLTGFDLGSKLRTIAALAGIPSSPDTDIQQFEAKLHRGPEGTAVQSLVLVVPSIGEVTGAGEISPRQELDFKMHVKLHTGGALMTALGQRGELAVPFFVRGTASSPSFVPDVKAIATDKVNQVLKNERVNELLNQNEATKAAKGLLDSFLKKR